MSTDQITQLEAAIAGLEAQRAVLGDAIINIALTPLRQQLEELRKSQPLADPRSHAQGTTANFQSPSFEGERKVVTIMFADVSGFTAMSEKMDPEQVRGLMNACFDALVPAIRKYDGAVDKFIGDEIMALFGAPTAHENDPERALRAALEMMDLLKDFNARRGTDLGLHFGLNTGPVIAGGIGAQQQQQYSVMGDAVNLAARLEDASERGEIFVGPDTHRLAAPLFDFEARDPIKVKGKAAPVPIYKLISAKAQPGKVRGLAGLESSMVGRDAELAKLLEAGGAARAGKGGGVVVVGEAGLGKTRLMAEWKKATTDNGRWTTEAPSVVGRPSLVIQWAEGRCLSYGQGLAYHLLIDLLHSLIGVPPAAEPEETNAALQALTDDLFPANALDVYPYLSHLLSLPMEGEALERVKPLDPQALQAQYLAALRQLLRALAARTPLIMILEDIHWADPSSTELLIKLLPLTQDSALLFCALTRPDPEAPGWRWVTAAREQLGERMTEVSLQPLSDDASRQLVANLLEVEALPERLRTIILHKAEGNPFFVEEVIRMLIDRGGLVKQGEHWAAVKEIENVEIPDNLQGLLMARIDRLPDDVKRTLRVASVIGRQFAVKVLEQVVAH